MLIPLVLGLTVVFWIIGTYNGLVRTRNHCRESWSDIDTELRRRHDLIPNLVSTVRAYAAHERDLFESVIAARDAADLPHDGAADQGRDESRLVRGLDRIFALSEGYPELRSDGQFLALQRELANTENRIQAARRFYNANVRDLNNRIEMFPSSVIASGRFEKWDYFEISDLSIRDVPQV